MKAAYLYVALAILQIIVIFSPFPKHSRSKRYTAVLTGITYLTILAYSTDVGFGATAYDIYFIILCFLIIFLVPRFKGYNSDSKARN